MSHLMQLITTREDNRREEKVEEELVVECHRIQDRPHAGQLQDETDDHSRKDGHDCFVKGLDLFAL
jgi:hypothetical protein